LFSVLADVAGRQNGPAVLETPRTRQNLTRGFTMTTVLSSVRDIKHASIPSEAALTGFQEDMAAIEIEMADRVAQDAQLAEINEWDSVHCRHCGHVTAGMSMAGSHVQLCDSCIFELVREQIGVAV